MVPAEQAGVYLVWLMLFHVLVSILRQLRELRRQRAAEAESSEARYVAALAHLTALRRSVVGRGILAERVAQRRRRRRGYVSGELLAITRRVYDAAAASQNAWEPSVHCHVCRVSTTHLSTDARA